MFQMPGEVLGTQGWLRKTWFCPQVTRSHVGTGHIIHQPQGFTAACASSNGEAWSIPVPGTQQGLGTSKNAFKHEGPAAYGQ